MKVEKEIRKYIAGKVVPDNIDKVTDETSLFESGVIDSLGVLQMVALFEKQFGIHVEDEELIPENFETIRNLIEYVESKLASVNT